MRGLKDVRKVLVDDQVLLNYEEAEIVPGGYSLILMKKGLSLKKNKKICRMCWQYLYSKDADMKVFELWFNNYKEDDICFGCQFKLEQIVIGRELATQNISSKVEDDEDKHRSLQEMCSR